MQGRGSTLALHKQKLAGTALAAVARAHNNGKKRIKSPEKHGGFSRKNTTSCAGIFPQNKSEKFRLFLRTFFQKVVAFS